MDRLITLNNICRICWVLISIALIIIIGTTYSICLYTKEPTTISGELEDVGWDLYFRDPAVGIKVNGERFLISKPSYSNRSYGFIQNKKLGDMLAILELKIGKQVHLECMKTGLKAGTIIRLTVDGIDYIEKDIALRDYIGTEKVTRIIGMVVLVFALVCWIIIRRRII